MNTSENANEIDRLRIILFFVIFPFYLLGSLIFSRIIYILISTQYYLSKGLSQSLALEEAQTQMMVLESQVILILIDTLFMVLLVFLWITKVEKRNFQWAELGLPRNLTSIKYYFAGLFLGALFIAVTMAAGLIQGSIQFNPLKIEEVFTQNNVKFLMLFFVWAMLNGFWQELIFRGYLQTRVVEKINPIVGILTVIVYFVFIHFIDRTLTLRFVILTTLLFIIISLMFHDTKSLWLVGAIHGMINYLTPVAELIGFEWLYPASNDWMKDLIILIFAVGFYILLRFVYFKRKKTKQMS